MAQLIHFIGAVLLAYLASRFIRLAPLAVRPWAGLTLAHLLSFAAVLALLAALRLPLHAFSTQQVYQAGLGQFAVFLIDAVRHNWPRLHSVQ